MRHGPHTTADDPTKYVPADEIAAAKEAEPIGRFARVLTERGLWDTERHAAAEARAEERFDLAWERAVAEAEALGPEALFENVFAVPTDRMRRQRSELMRHLASEA